MYKEKALITNCNNYYLIKMIVIRFVLTLYGNKKKVIKIIKNYYYYYYY